MWGGGIKEEEKGEKGEKGKRTENTEKFVSVNIMEFSRLRG
jgi:hypothetical protein